MLRPSQQVIKKFLNDHETGAVFVAMREGKTRAVLAHLQDEKIDTILYKKKNFKMCLIVAPLRTLKNVWVDEIYKAGFKLTYAIFTSKTTVLPMVDIVLTNPEKLHIFFKYFGGDVQNSVAFSHLILDESTLFQNWTAKRTLVLRRFLKYFTHRYILSGTPFHNGVEGIYSQFYVVDLGDSLGKNKGAFKNSFGFFRHEFYGKRVVKWYPRLESEVEIIKKISKKTLFIDNHLAQNLDFHTISFKFSKEYQDILNTFKKTHVLPQALLSQGNFKAHNQLPKNVFSSLQQLTSGFLYNDPHESYLFNKQRLNLALDLLNQTQKRYLIGSMFTSDTKNLLAGLKDTLALDPKSKHTLAKQIQNCKHLIAHPKQIAHGVDLSKEFQGVFWYTLPTSLELFTQFNARLLNKGKNEKTPVYILQATNTLDEHIYDLLKHKIRDIKRYHLYLEENNV